MLLAFAILSFLSSILIVWLYVSRNLIRRLMHLSTGMVAIAAGTRQEPIQISGNDEVAEMGRVVEVFRKNTLERDDLLAEKAQAADRLENEVKQRTAELAQSVQELRALGDVSQAVNSTIDLETVLFTIVSPPSSFPGQGWHHLLFDPSGARIPHARQLRHGRRDDRGIKGPHPHG
jgi:nitrate/nitrite-specific signal transduction histidine kinase